nr:DUF3322 domain-containing protein [Noviherbaspirillum cavernae]
MRPDRRPRRPTARRLLQDRARIRANSERNRPVDDHPHSNLNPCQIPVEGLDTKWIEPRRQIALQWLVVIRGIVGRGYAVEVLAELPSG